MEVSVVGERSFSRRRYDEYKLFMSIMGNVFYYYLFWGLKHRLLIDGISMLRKSKAIKT